jgi:hypothetical protein
MSPVTRTGEKKSGELGIGDGDGSNDHRCLELEINITWVLGDTANQSGD